MDVYVDGSYSGITGESGYAFVVVQNNQIIYEESGLCEKRIESTLLDSHYAELFSWVKAFSYMKKKNYNNFSFFYDSETAYDFVLGKTKGNYVGLLRMIEGMQEDKNGLNILFRKVKAHSDDEWNEYVHTLAFDVIRKGMCHINVAERIENEIQKIKNGMNGYRSYLLNTQKKKIKKILSSLYKKEEWGKEDLKQARRANVVIDKTIERIRYINEEIFGTTKREEVLKEAESMLELERTNRLFIEKKFETIFYQIKKDEKVTDEERFWFYQMYKQKQKQIKKRNEYVS